MLFRKGREHDLANRCIECPAEISGTPVSRSGSAQRLRGNSLKHHASETYVLCAIRPLSFNGNRRFFPGDREFLLALGIGHDLPGDRDMPHIARKRPVFCRIRCKFMECHSKALDGIRLYREEWSGKGNLCFMAEW